MPLWVVICGSYSDINDVQVFSDVRQAELYRIAWYRKRLHSSWCDIMEAEIDKEVVNGG